MKTKANLDIRSEAKMAGVSLWEIAEELGLCDSSFSRLLRHELSGQQKARIRKIIKKKEELL